MMPKSAGDLHNGTGESTLIPALQQREGPGAVLKRPTEFYLARPQAGLRGLDGVESLTAGRVK